MWSHQLWMPIFIAIKILATVFLCVSRLICPSTKNIPHLLDLGRLFSWRAQGLDTKSVNLG